MRLVSLTGLLAIIALGCTTAQPPATTASDEAVKCDITEQTAEIAEPTKAVQAETTVAKTAKATPKTIAIAGTVVDSKGNPVAEATVSCANHRVTTATDGTFKMDIDERFKRFSISASSKDKTLSGYTRLKGDLAKLSVTVTPIPEQVVSGVVKDMSGTPVAGAKVEYAKSSVTTAADGTFTLKMRSRSPIRSVKATSADGKLSATKQVAGKKGNVVVSIAPACDCSFVLKDNDGNPIPNMRVSIYGPGTRTSFSSDASGNCTAKSLTEGAKYTISWRGAKSTFVKNGSKKFIAKPDTKIDVTVAAFQPPKGTIGASDETRLGRVTGFCLDANENLVVCDKEKTHLKVISQDDKLVSTWELGFNPEVVEPCDKGFVVAGNGSIAIIDEAGKIITKGAIPEKGKSATGVGASADHVFVCTRAKTGYTVFKMTKDLKSSEMIVKGLRGCCGQMDFTVNGGNVYVAENARFKLNKYDLDGKVIAKYGKRGGKDGFGGCCEPKNVFFDSEGSIYLSESGKCCVKKFSADGEYIGQVGRVTDINSCVRVTIAVTKDKKIYMLDTGFNLIRLVPYSEPKSAGAPPKTDKG